MTNRTKRDRMKRKVAQAHRKLENALLDIKCIYDLFENVHPELAEGLEMAGENIVCAQQIIETFAMSSWNMDTISMMKFL